MLGFKNGRAFLEWLPGSGCRVICRGKDRLVLVEEAEAALLRRGGTGRSAEVTESDEPASASQVLARIGRRHSGGAR